MREEIYDRIYEEEKDEQVIRCAMELERMFRDAGMEPQNGRYLIKIVSREDAASSEREEPVKIFTERSFYTEKPDQYWFPTDKDVLAGYINVFTEEKTVIVGDSLPDDFFSRNFASPAICVKPFEDEKQLFSSPKRYFIDTNAAFEFIDSFSQKRKEELLHELEKYEGLKKETTENIEGIIALYESLDEDEREEFELLIDTTNVSYTMNDKPNYVWDAKRQELMEKYGENWKTAYTSEDVVGYYYNSITLPLFFAACNNLKNDAFEKAVECEADEIMEKDATHWMKMALDSYNYYFDRQIRNNKWILSGFHYEVTVTGGDDAPAPLIFKPFAQDSNLYKFGDKLKKYVENNMNGAIKY